MQKIFSKIAKNNNTDEATVKREISLAIEQAMKNSKGNPQAEAFWNNIAKDGQVPTPEEVISAIAEKIRSESKLNQ